MSLLESSLTLEPNFSCVSLFNIVRGSSFSRRNLDKTISIFMHDAMYTNETKTNRLLLNITLKTTVATKIKK